MTAPVPTIATRIRGRAASDPHRVALREKCLGVWQETTWAEYGDLVERAAHGLLALGVRPRDRVAVESENRPEWLVADAAAVAARAVTAALEPGARVLIAEGQEQVDRALAARAGLPELEWIVYIEPRGVRDYADQSLVWWPDLLRRGAEHRAEHPRQLDELAAEVGEDDPLTPELSAGELNLALAAFADAGQLHPNPGPGDFAVCHLPLAQIASRMSSGWLNAHAGVQLHFGEPTADLVHTLNEVEPSLFFATPGVWERLRASVRTRKRTGRLYARAARKRLGLRKCRSAVSAPPLAPELVEWWAGLGIPVRSVEFPKDVA
jgi:long-chain acyl-CoA synthetase